MTAATAHTEEPARTPTVLTILVARDASDRLKELLSALASQTHRRLAVIAIDDGSSDGSRAILAEALGERRVLGWDQPRGFGASVGAALSLPMAAQADFVLIIGDDAVPDPDAVEGLLAAAVGIQGVTDVGIVGPKVVDFSEPKVLRDVGRAADRLGRPYTPLQPGDIDQGQFDRVLEVFAVCSTMMLMSRETWQLIGGFDERLAREEAELDLCWRARLAGFRVLMVPRARVRQRRELPAASSRGDRLRSPTYDEDRGALASMLRNYSAPSLLLFLPLAILVGLGRALVLTLERRFEEAYDVVAAMGWNVIHLPSTLALRRRTQRTRRVRDRQMRRFQASTWMRLPKWFLAAERIIDEQREVQETDADEGAVPRFRDRTVSLVGGHPILVGSVFAILIGAIATRDILGPEPLVGGALPVFPAEPAGFIGELLSAFRTTGLGGSLAASPALAGMGGLSTLLARSTSVAKEVMLVAGPALAAILLYRAAARLTERRGAAVVAAGAYLLSAVVLWSFSEGRLALLVTLAVIPVLYERCDVAFGTVEPPGGRLRFAVGLGLTLAVGLAFEPGVGLSFGVLVLVQVGLGRARVQGLQLVGASAVVAAVLLFPFVPTLFSGRGLGWWSGIWTTDVRMLSRLALGLGPGSWELAFFLPIAAILCFALVRPPHRRRALQAFLVASLSLGCAWLSAAGWLPTWMTNAPVYIATAGAAEAFLVSFGLASVTSGIGREAFGLRQIGIVTVALVLALGMAGQAAVAMVGDWAVGGPDSIPAAWLVVQSEARGDVRILWVGSDSGKRFAAPGGDPEGIAEAGDATVRWALTSRRGATALDTGRPLSGPGRLALEEALNEILSGTTSHGGALLAPFAVQFVLAENNDLPSAAFRALDRQVDLNLEPAGGFIVFRNAAAFPVGSAIRLSEGFAASLGEESGDSVKLGQVRYVPVPRAEGGWRGISGGGQLLALSTEFDDAWVLEGTDRLARRSFGWATSFGRPPSAIRVTYGAQLPRTIQMFLLAAIWLTALWITRRPVVR